MPFSVPTNQLQIAHQAFENECFEIKSATYNYYKIENSDCIEFVFKIDLENEIHRDKTLQESFPGLPDLEVSAIIQSSDFTLEKGTKIVQAFGYDEERQENLSVLYYFSHNSVENLQLEIVACNESSIKVHIKGESAIHSGDWQNPDATIYATTWLSRNHQLSRSFN